MATAIPFPGWQTGDANGTPESGGKIFFYVVGTTTPIITYSDTALTTPNANPVVMDASGWVVPIYVSSETAYDYIVKSSDEATTLKARTTVPSSVSGAQPVDATLTAIAGLVVADNDIIRATGVDTFEAVSESAFLAPAYARGVVIIDAEKDYTHASLQDRVEAAISDANPGDTVKLPQTAFNIATAIAIPKAIHILAGNADMTVTANVAAFTFTNPTYEVRALSSNYTAGDLTITVATMTNPPSAGDWVKIHSDAVDPYNRDSGSETNQYRCGEWAQVLSSTSTVITLRSPLRFPVGISPTSTAGDEGEIAAYTTAMAARVIVVDQTYAPPSWTGNLPNYESGHDATPWANDALSFFGFPGATVTDAKMSLGYRKGVKFGGCPGWRMTGGKISNLTDNSANGQFGYAVGDDSGYGVLSGLHVYNVRHGYTTDAESMAAGTTTLVELLSSGRTVGTVVENCVGGGSATIDWDTHHDAHDVTFINCISDGSVGGFQYRGQNGMIQNCSVFRCKTNAIQVNTEYASGDTDDDFWTASKTRGPTTCVVDGGYFEGGTSWVFSATGAREVILRGHIKLRSSSTYVFRNLYSLIRVEGTVDLLVTDVNGVAPTVTSTAAIYSDYVATLPHDQEIIISESGLLKYDATAATGATGNRALGIYNGTQFIVRGVAEFRLPASASELVNNTASNLVCEGAGVIKVSEEGGADSALPIRYVTSPRTRIEAIDGSAYYDGVAEPERAYQLERRLALDTTHTGTGAYVDSAIAVAAYGLKVMDAAGHRYTMRLRGRKTGTTSTAALRFDWAGALGQTITLAADQVAFDFDFDVLMRGNDSQYISYQGVSNTGAPVRTDYASASYETVNIAASNESFRCDVDAAVGDTIIFDDVEIWSSRPLVGFTS